MATKAKDAWFGERVDAIIGSIWSSDYSAIVEEIDRLTEEEASRSRGKRLSLAARRTISDLRVLAAHKTARPISESDGLHAKRRRLGFRSLLEEAISVTAHVRYCGKAGEIEQAARHATAMLKRIRLRRGSAKPPVPPELEAILKAHVGQRKGDGPGKGQIPNQGHRETKAKR